MSDADTDYHLFAWETYYPDGGWNDLVATFKTKGEAIAHLEAFPVHYDHAQIVHDGEEVVRLYFCADASRYTDATNHWCRWDEYQAHTHKGVPPDGVNVPTPKAHRWVKKPDDFDITRHPNGGGR